MHSAAVSVPIYFYHLPLMGVVRVGVSGHLNQSAEDDTDKYQRGGMVVMETEFNMKDAIWRLIVPVLINVHTYLCEGETETRSYCLWRNKLT